MTVTTPPTVLLCSNLPPEPSILIIFNYFSVLFVYTVIIFIFPLCIIISIFLILFFELSKTVSCNTLPSPYDSWTRQQTTATLRSGRWTFPLMSHWNSHLSSCCCDGAKPPTNPCADPPCRTQTITFSEKKTQVIHISNIISLCFVFVDFPPGHHQRSTQFFPSSPSFSHQPHRHLRHFTGAVN